MNGFELPPAFVLLEACCLRLSVALLHFLWQGVLIGLLAVGVSRLLRHRSANARYVANAVALSMMALCLAGTFVMTPVPSIASIDRSDPAIHSVMDQAYGEPPMAAIQRGDDERPNDAAAVQQSPALVAANRSSEITPKDGFAAVPATVGEDTAVAAIADRVAGPHAGPVEGLIATILAGLKPWANLVAGAYVLGVLAMMFRVMLALWGGHRLRRDATLIGEPGLLELVQVQTRRIGLKAAPAIAYCQRVATPAVVGILRPMILLPPAALSGLSTFELEALLIHELAHIRRYDLLVNLLQRLVEAVLFFHPAVWYVSRRLNVEREHCCDDLVLSAGIPPLGYADALVRMAEICSGASTAAEVALAANAGKCPTELKRRVLRVLDPAGQPGPRLRLTRWGVVCFLAMWVGLILAPAAFEVWVGNGSDAAAEQVDTPSQDRAALLALARQDRFEEGKVVSLDPIFGTITGRGGKPVVGAKVYLREHPISWESWGRNTPTTTRDLTATVADDKGQFRFENVESQPLNILRQEVLPVDLIVVAEGYAVAWREMSECGAADFQLKLGATVRGRIVDEQGRAATGTTIRVLRFVPLTEIANMNLAHHSYPRTIDNTLDLACAGFQIAAAADEQGEFVLDGLPQNSGSVLEVSDPRYHCEVVYTTANPDHPTWRDSAKLSEPAASSYYVPSPYDSSPSVNQETKRRARFGLRESVQVSPIQLALHRGIQLRVRVVDDETGEPIRQARLPEGPIFTYPGRGLTDDNGEYLYTQLEPGFLSLEDIPPDGSQWIEQRAEVELTEGSFEAAAEVRLSRAALIAGKVVDRTTGRGIPDVPLRHVVAREHGSVVANTKTAQDGTFRIMGAPGDGSVKIHGSVAGYETPILSGTVPEQFSRNVHATLKEPLTDVIFELEPDVLFHGRTLGPQGEPIGGVEITGSIPRGSDGNAYSPVKLTSQRDGRYVLVGFYADVLQNRQPEIPILFQDKSRGLAVRVVFSPPTDEIKEIEQDIRLLPAGTVTGRVIDDHTKKPIAGAAIGVLLWTGNGGQHVGGARTDDQGRYTYTGLVPGEEHTVDIRAEGFSSNDGQSACSEHFSVEPGEVHSIPDFLMTPKVVAQSVVDIPEATAPDITGLSPQEALQRLLSRYQEDHIAYRERVDAAKDQSLINKIVARQEPTNAYSVAFETLAKANPNSDVELKSLIWICGSSVVAGIDATKLYDRKGAAANRLMEKYIDRQEIVDCLDSLVYRTEKPHETALALMDKSPHREVQGRACLLAAQVFERDLDLAKQMGRSPSEAVRRQAIQYYRQAATQYGDVPYWQTSTIGEHAAKALNELENLWIGAEAPDIVGQDLDGKPLKLSDFRGKIVILAFTDQIRYWSLMPKTIEQYTKDGQVVVLGVYSGQDRGAARQVAIEQELDWPIWFDAANQPGSIVSAWNNTSWPNYHVLDQQGVIRYKDIDRNRIPGAIESLWPKREK
jgi:beta-lactamase regulating signal transducer with metallopeptidase domain/peroxiredoxin/protocatechuate 3,4-dioxygenase beta subunit